MAGSRRDGSPFMNLLMSAPLCDSRGRIRYFIGAQVDVSGIVKDCSDLESFRRLVTKENVYHDDVNGNANEEEESEKDELQQLSELLSASELDTIRRHGGRSHREPVEMDEDASSVNWNKPRLHLAEPSPDIGKNGQIGARVSGKLSGVYQHVGLLLAFSLALYDIQWPI